MSRSGSLLGWSREKKDGYVNMEVDLNGEMTLSLPNEVLSGGAECLGGILWPAAIASALLLRRLAWRNVFESKRVVELGAGLGLTGLSAATPSVESARPAMDVTLTDYEPAVVAALHDTTKKHAAAFPTCSSLCVKSLDWGSCVPHVDGDKECPTNQDHFDVVLGSDIAYYPQLVRPVMDAASSLLGPTGGLLILASSSQRASHWALYRNLKDGCVNQRTNEREPPWPGTTRMFMYDLHRASWEKVLDDRSPLDASSSWSPPASSAAADDVWVVPIAVIVHASPGVDVGSITSHFNNQDATASDEDEGCGRYA